MIKLLVTRYEFSLIFCVVLLFGSPPALAQENVELPTLGGETVNPILSLEPAPIEADIKDRDLSTTLVLSPEINEIVPTELVILRVVEDELQEIYKEDLFEAPDFQSLMFLPSEYAMLTAAKASFVEVNPEDEGADEDSQGGTDIFPEEILEDIIREVKLGGILYTGPDNWIVWINEQRVTPKAMPEEIVDIKVRKDHIELKWEDQQTNTIFPIRLKPNQRFNLDARIFLPG